MQGKLGGNMGLFGKTKPRLASKPRKLKPGAMIPMVDVDPEFIEWVRANKPLDARSKSHKATVRLDYDGTDIVARAADYVIVGKMRPQSVELYAREFAAMHARGYYGVADVAISRADLKPRYSLLINYDEACRDGGIL